MSELDNILPSVPDQPVIEQNIPKKIEFLGSHRKIKGLTMFEFDPIAMTLKPATYKEIIPEVIHNSPLLENEVRVMEVKSVVHHKLIPKEGCVYIQALNKRNAYKKIAKIKK